MCTGVCSKAFLMSLKFGNFQPQLNSFEALQTKTKFLNQPHRLSSATGQESHERPLYTQMGRKLQFSMWRATGLVIWCNPNSHEVMFRPQSVNKNSNTTHIQQINIFCTKTKLLICADVYLESRKWYFIIWRLCIFFSLLNEHWENWIWWWTIDINISSNKITAD